VVLPADTLEDEEVFLSGSQDDNSLYAVVCACQILDKVRYFQWLSGDDVVSEDSPPQERKTEKAKEGDVGGLAGENAAAASGGEGAGAGGRGGGEELVFLCRRRYDAETHQVSELSDTEIEIQNAVRGIVPLDKVLLGHIRTFQQDWIAACRRYGVGTYSSDHELAPCTHAFMEKLPRLCTGTPVCWFNTKLALTAAAAPTTSVYAPHEIVFRNSNCLINRQEEGPTEDDCLLELESFEAWFAATDTTDKDLAREANSAELPPPTNSATNSAFARDMTPPLAPGGTGRKARAGCGGGGGVGGRMSEARKKESPEAACNMPRRNSAFSHPSNVPSARALPRDLRGFARGREERKGGRGGGGGNAGKGCIKGMGRAFEVGSRVKVRITNVLLMCC
jgi:hypothetical protein